MGNGVSFIAGVVLILGCGSALLRFDARER